MRPVRERLYIKVFLESIDRTSTDRRGINDAALVWLGARARAWRR